MKRRVLPEGGADQNMLARNHSLSDIVSWETAGVDKKIYKKKPLAGKKAGVWPRTGQPGADFPVGLGVAAGAAPITPLRAGDKVPDRGCACIPGTDHG